MDTLTFTNAGKGSRNTPSSSRESWIGLAIVANQFLRGGTRLALREEEEEDICRSLGISFSPTRPRRAFLLLSFMSIFHSLSFFVFLSLFLSFSLSLGYNTVDDGGSLCWIDDGRCYSVKNWY